MLRLSWLVLVVVLVGCLIGAPFAASEAAHYLVVSDVMKPARAIVVLGGDLPFRALEAARGYELDWAEQVWVTQGAEFGSDAALKALKITRPAEHEYSQIVLRTRGVPASAIRVLPGPNLNTADELRTVIEHLKTVGEGPVVLVTSKPQARRVRVIWQKLGGDPYDAIVRFKEDDPFDPNGWWRNIDDAKNVAYEWAGILNAWAGFPVSSVRD